MSEESLAVVREMNEAFNRGNERWLEFYAPDVEFVMPPDWPDEPVHRGRESLARLLSTLTPVFGAQQWRIQSAGALVNTASGMCLDDPGDNPVAGTQPVIFSGTATTGEYWHVE